MNILHVTTHFHPFIGGLENLVLDVATHQSKTNNVSILTLQYSKNLPVKELVEKIKVMRHPSCTILKDQYSLPQWGFSRRILERNPDVLFTHTRFFLTSFLAGRYFKKNFPNRKWIHVEHGQNFVTSCNSFVKFSARIFDEILGRWIFRHADTVVIMSKTGEIFVRKLGAQNIQIISTGVDIPENIQTPPGKNKALFFGRLVREKGILEIIEAAEKCSEWNFELVGSGPLFKVKNLANVMWTGEIAHEKMNKKIQSADVIILPSWSESVSMAVLESCANGRAVLASDVGENANILSLDFLIPPRDRDALVKKLKALAGKYEVLEMEGKKNREFAMRKFSREKMLEEYDKVLKKTEN